MNKTIAVMFLIAAAATCCLAATNGDGQTATTQTSQAASLPKDAAKNPDGTYSWTDTQGRKWIYRKTEMGLAKFPADKVGTDRSATIPKDAVKNPDGSYLWTDKTGAKWQLKETPFGISKTALDSHSATTAASFVKVTDRGDTVKFERPGPFGVTTYEKKKSDLTAEERRLYEASKTKPE